MKSNIEDLQKQLKLANETYRSGYPVYSDEEYDILLRKYESLTGVKEILTEVGGDIKHKYIIGSLNKIKAEDNNLYAWCLKNNIEELFCSFKLDGASWVGEYLDGELISLSTRGDGYSGVCLLNKAIHIQIPIEIIGRFTGTVRGELVLEGDSHTVLGMKNRRNGVCGLLNRKDAAQGDLEHIKAYAYQILSSDKAIYEQFIDLERLGFNVPFNAIIEVHPSIIETIQQLFYTDNQEFDFDGIVVSSKEYTNEDVFLPVGQIALKFNSEGVYTTVKYIEWELSKGRLLKPTAVLEPIDIDGSTISRVTCNNARWLFDRGINIGAKVSLIRSGNVIPKIIDIIEEAEEAAIPAFCPECNTGLVWTRDQYGNQGNDLQCPNVKCGEVKRIESFIKNLDIENVSEKRLIEFGILTFDNLTDFVPDKKYKSQISFSEELSKKMWGQSPVTLMRSFSYDGLGTTLFDKIYSQYKTLEAMHALFNLEDFKGIVLPDGIGIRTIEKAKQDWNTNYTILAYILSNKAYDYKEPEDDGNTHSDLSGKLDGKSFVVTGKMAIGSRSVIEKLIVENGGSNASSVSKTLSYLICGPDSWGSSSKYVKAEKLGVAIITENEFLEMVDLGEGSGNA